jgi:hypothetical protein
VIRCPLLASVVFTSYATGRCTSTQAPHSAGDSSPVLACSSYHTCLLPPLGCVICYKRLGCPGARVRRPLDSLVARIPPPSCTRASRSLTPSLVYKVGYMLQLAREALHPFPLASSYASLSTCRWGGSEAVRHHLHRLRWACMGEARGRGIESCGNQQGVVYRHMHTAAPTHTHRDDLFSLEPLEQPAQHGLAPDVGVLAAVCRRVHTHTHTRTHARSRGARRAWGR